MKSEEAPHTLPLVTAGQGAAPAAVQPLRLCVVDGPDRGAEVLIAQGTAVVGTAPECQLVLKDAAVSRRHLSIELCGYRFRVTDLGSRNGTRYHGAKVQSVDVPFGATLTVGRSQLTLLPAKRAGVGEALSDRTELAGLLGVSVKMRKLFADIERAGPAEVSVLISGETGSGKEGVARGLHQLSKRAAGPFKVFDCGAASPELIQAALFGHAKGAFTGATNATPGALELADGGTLFLDEIGELPLELQPALLRALQDGTFTRLGESQVRKADFRVVAATHRDLAAAAKKGTFRADLYHRLCSVVLEVPPLRERPEDIPLLADHFARQADRTLELSPELTATLCAYPWPGNVRELSNVVERALVIGPQAALPEPFARVPGGAAGSEDFHQARERLLKVFERSYLKAQLERHKGSISAAAKASGMARSYFYKLLDEHGLK